MKVYDAIPGGFSYVLGSSKLNGVDISDPTVSGGLLTWNIGSIKKSESLILTYKLKIGDTVVRGGTYTNYATCDAYYGQREENTLLRVLIDQVTLNKIECNFSGSSVSISTSNSYGGSLTGQVLGASTELPATGNPTWTLVVSLLSLTGGIYLKKKYE